MKYYYVELVRKQLGCLRLEPVEEESRLFSSMEAAEEWLVNNGFVLGQRSCYHYSTGDKEWFHRTDISTDLIVVSIVEMDVDDTTDSIFKYKCPRIWP